MKKKFLAAGLLAAVLVAGAGTPLLAQQTTESGNTESDEIVIRKKGSKDEKVTVEFKDGEVMVNGKPMSEYKDDDVSISRRRSVVGRGLTFAPSSAFRGGAYSFNDNNGTGTTRTFRSYANVNANKAMLGVATTADDGGARVNSVTSKSPAEKAGLKEGDIITKVDNTAVSNPEDLTKAIGKYKPNDKVSITYKRDKKEQKATVTLAKREDATTLYMGDGLANRNFNFDFSPGTDGAFNYIMRGSGPRLGLQAQDTEDGKGVKVLKVEEESNAAKAGIREGDVITQFNGQDVNNTTDLMEAAKDMKDKNAIKVKLSRDGKNQEMEIKIPKKLKTATL